MVSLHWHFFKKNYTTDLFPYLPSKTHWDCGSGRGCARCARVCSTAHALIQTGFNAEDSLFLHIQFLILLCDIIALYT